MRTSSRVQIMKDFECVVKAGGKVKTTNEGVNESVMVTVGKARRGRGVSYSNSGVVCVWNGWRKQEEVE